MDKLEAAVNATLRLIQAENAMHPYRGQINAFMKNPDYPICYAAQDAFEDWAAERIDTHNTFRRAGLTWCQDWTAEDYFTSAQTAFKRSIKEF